MCKSYPFGPLATKVLVTLVFCIVILVTSLTLYIFRFVENQESDSNETEVESIEDHDAFLPFEVWQFRKNYSSSSKILDNMSKRVINVMTHDKTIEDLMSKGSLGYDDPILLEYFTEEYLIPPDESRNHNPAVESDSVHFPEEDISAYPTHKNMNGFYITYGSESEVTNFDTIRLGKEGWNGVLIEPDPILFGKTLLQEKNIWLANACLSTSQTVQQKSYLQESGLSIQVPCFPFYTILLSLERNIVDFFSINAESSGLEILKTIPFDKVLIKILSVHLQNSSEILSLELFLRGNGYSLHKSVDNTFSKNFIFVHNSLRLA